MRWAGHVFLWGHTWVWWGTPKERNHLEDLGVGLRGMKWERPFEVQPVIIYFLFIFTLSPNNHFLEQKLSVKKYFVQLMEAPFKIHTPFLFRTVNLVTSLTFR
jgi:hypothetical protein